MLIVIEGADGCGKNTQIDLLRKKLEFEFFKYPTKNFPIIEDYLEGRVTLHPKSLFLLFLADIAEEQAKLKKAVASGKPVIVDRYIFSTIAYELGAIGYEDSKEIINKIGFLAPDKVVLLDVDPEVAQERKRKQKSLDRYESDLNYQKKVRKDFLSLYEEKYLAKEWIKIDVSGSIEEVQETFLRALNI